MLRKVTDNEDAERLKDGIGDDEREIPPRAELNEGVPGAGGIGELLENAEPKGHGEEHDHPEHGGDADISGAARIFFLKHLI